MSRTARIFGALCAAALAAFSLSAAAGQASTATLTGTVSDEKGAVVAGANITVTNAATGARRDTTTNDSGQFFVSQLPPSNYTTLVEATGFRRSEVRDVILNVNDQRTLNIELKVGEVGATVQVTTDPPLLDESAAVATTTNREFVQNLPLNGRSFQSLYELTPGVNLVPSGAEGPGQFSANGQRTNANYLTIDGVGANVGSQAGNNLGQSANGSVAGFSASGGSNNLVSVDALQEFTIQTSTYAPEFGRTPGAQISIVTRSGSNRWTGSVFEYFRNEALDANDWFANSLRLKRAPLRLNNFGGVIGGPIIKDRTFFFFSYEGLRLKQPRAGTFFVPSAQLRAQAAPAFRPILNGFPQPNGPLDLNSAGQPTGYAAYNAAISDDVKTDATSFRIDHKFTDNINVFGRYNEAPSSTIDRFSNPSTPATVSVTTRGLTLGSTQIFGSKAVNDIRFNWTKYASAVDTELDTSGGAVPFDALSFAPSSAQQPTIGFFILDLDPNTFALRFAPGLFIGRLGNNRNQQINIVDNFSYRLGSHALKFGFDYRRLNPTYSAADYFGTYVIQTWSSLASNGPFPGQNHLIAGLVNSLQITADSGERNPIFHNYSFYAQDTWKANSRLTLTYGLRYEVNPAPKERDGKNPVVLTNLETPANIAVAPAGTPLYRTTYDNFAPRLGVAYQLNQATGRETVIRGGFGMFYDLGGGNAAGAAFSRAFPFVGVRNVAPVPPATGISFPLPPAQTAPPPIATTLPTSDVIYAWDPEIELPVTYQWNLAVEQSLGSNQTVSATYAAARGRDLLRQEFIRNPNTAIFAGANNGVAITRNTAESDYDSLQLQFNRRLTRGFQALASYTLAKSTDTASSDVTRNASILVIDSETDRGPSSFDVRHNFTGAVTYNIPSPFKSNKVAKAILGGWSTDAIFRYRSAPPVNVTIQRTIDGVANTTRPNVVIGQPFYLDDPGAPGGKRLNPAAFALPPVGTRGDLPRNALRGFSARQIDFTIRRDFKFRENMGIQFRAEFFNIFNIPNFANPNSRIGNPQFGRATQMLARGLNDLNAGGAGLSPVFQIGGPRSIQLSARFYF